MSLWFVIWWIKAGVASEFWLGTSGLFASQRRLAANRAGARKETDGTHLETTVSINLCQVCSDLKSGVSGGFADSPSCCSEVPAIVGHPESAIGNTQKSFQRLVWASSWRLTSGPLQGARNQWALSKPAHYLLTEGRFCCSPTQAEKQTQKSKRRLQQASAGVNYSI